MNAFPCYRSLNYPIEVRIKSIIGNGYGDKTLHLRQLTNKKGEQVMDCFEEKIKPENLPPPPTGALRLRLANLPWNLGGMSGELTCIKGKYNWLIPTVDWTTYYSKDSAQMDKMYAHLMANYERNKVRNEETNKMIRETMFFCTLIVVIGIVCMVGVTLYIAVHTALDNTALLTGIKDAAVKGVIEGLNTLRTVSDPLVPGPV